MRCGKCGSDNREGRKFCAKCGSPLARSCPKCGASNEPGEDFCGDCGSPLSGNRVGSYSPPPSSSTPETQTDTGQIGESAPAKGERRHLTVLFCDLVNSTEMAAQLDPEEWRDILARYQRVAAEAVARFEGYIAQYLGDGVLAWFGYPAAHENDAERAVRTGLVIIDGVATLNTSLDVKGLQALAVRVGIHAGPVVVGDSDNKSANVFGDTPNVAARVQAAAERDTVVVSAAVHQLVSGLFVVEDRGAHTLKGIAHPVRLYRVVRPSGLHGRFEAAAAAGGLTSFVGREDELRSLLSRWERVAEGDGQVALVIGEAGIGKSRVLRRFHEQIASSSHTWLQAGAEAFFQNSPFYPIAGLLRQFLSDAKDPDPYAQLESRLIGVGLSPGEAIPLIAPLLNLPPSAKYPALSISPDQQRRRLLATLVEWLIGAARKQPVVSVIEDLHWADPSTVELLGLLLAQVATTRVLVLLTFRPEFSPALGTALLPQSAHPQPFRPQASRGDGAAGHGRQSPAPGGGAADRQQDGRRPIVRGRADQDGGGVRLGQRGRGTV